MLDRIMDRFYYRDVLEQHRQPSNNHFILVQRCIFMHDNEPKPTSELIKDWLKRERIQTRGAESTRVRVRPYGENFENLCIWGKFLKNFFFFRGKKVSLEENIFPLGDIF